MKPGRYTELPHLTVLSSGIEAAWMSFSHQAGAYRVLPDGRCDIILKFIKKNNALSELTVIVTGPSAIFYDVPLLPGIGFVGIRLKPGYFKTILGLDPILFQGRGLIGTAAQNALPALKTLCEPASSHEELAHRLIKFVSARYEASPFKVTPLGQNLISAIHASGGRLRIADVADMHDISERTARRIILHAIGLSPKIFSSIIQFHRALRLLRDHHLTLADVAIEAGFTDQSHMNRVFRRMGGFSPGRLPEITLVTISD